jgi:hypothetical protein
MAAMIAMFRFVSFFDRYVLALRGLELPGRPEQGGRFGDDCAHSTGCAAVPE